jgi:hypothetical protein
LGDIAGVIGALVCLVSGATRFLGSWNLAGVQISALFNLGIGLMVFACLTKLHAISVGTAPPKISK